MFNDTEIQLDNNSDKLINLIEEAISRKHIKYYEYKHFHNIEKIGNDTLKKVYRPFSSLIDHHFCET
jgi:hypothetical protein